MHAAGLLILTAHVSSLCKGDAVRKILSNVKKLVKSTLYVHLNNFNDDSENFVPTTNLSNALYSSGLQKQNYFNADVLPFVTKFYSEAALHCGHLDVNVLLHNIGEKSSTEKQKLLHNSIHCILIDLPGTITKESCDVVRNFVSSGYVFKKSEASNHDLPLPVYGVNAGDQTSENHQAAQESRSTIHKRESVVLGGTFDRIHTGHKVLLSESILLACRKIVIGVSEGPLLERKTLKELIEPVKLRMRLLEEFVVSVAKPGIDLHITSIQDQYGPSITDPDINAIIVSKETEKGGHMVNEKRKERGLSQLDVHIIGQGTLLEDSDDADQTEIPFDEHKASSSNARFRQLGTLLQPVKEVSLDFLPTLSRQPYLLGLTGGIAAGKSSVAKRLEGLGAIIIDCDKLGHQSYLPGSDTFNSIVKHFGGDIVADDGTINRRKLGEKVFAEKSQLNALNAIVWPEIKRLSKKEIEKQMQKVLTNTSNVIQQQVFVLDAAILLEAKWDEFVNEVWVVNVPISEAVTRIMDRNHLSEENARMRIESQRSNEWRTERANVVLSTLWEPSVTQKLVEKSWKLLQYRITMKIDQNNSSNMQEKGHKL